MDEQERALILAAQRGDREATRELVAMHQEKIYNFAFKVCRNEQDAEDTLQTAFLNVLQALKSFKFQSNFSTWLYRIVSNSCLMKWRKEKRSRWESWEDLDRPEERIREHYSRWPETPDGAVLQTELKTKMDEAILNLPPIYRLAFVLKDVEGLSTEEMARALDISLPAAKARLRRARLFLRDELGAYFEN